MAKPQEMLQAWRERKEDFFKQFRLLVVLLQQQVELRELHAMLAQRRMSRWQAPFLL
jgi:hypothetical protein